MGLDALKLNDAQRRAVEHDAGPLAVLAGPGTGKTRVLTARVAHMVAQRGIEPGRIVALTFTNKAAGELRERLSDLLDPSAAEGVWAGTFHAFGHMLVRRFGDEAGYGSRSRLADDAELKRLARALIDEHGLFGAARGRSVEHASEALLPIVDRLRHAAKRADTVRSFVEAELPKCAPEARTGLLDLRDAGELMRRLDEACRSRQWLAVDHLLSVPTALVGSDARVAEGVRAAYRHVVVDEFQDVNTQQIEMLRALCPPGADGGPDLCVVGDDDQSIYGFRGADDRAFARFETIWQGAQVIELRENYRSAARVVAVSNDVIGRANTRFRPDKRVEAAGDHADDGVVTAVVASDPEEMGEVVAFDLLEHHATGALASWSEAAVIARSRTHLHRVAAALELEGVPYVIDKPTAMDDAGVRDVLAWVELLCEPTAAWAARRVLTRPPVGASPELVQGAERAYRSARTRHEQGEGDDPGPYARWLAAQHPDDERVSRFAALYEHLAGFAASNRADETVFEIVRKADVVHADLLPPRARAGRLRAVVGMVRFARACAERLERPGGLAELLAHAADLDDRDRWARTSAESVGVTPEGEGAGADAVRLVTAHGSKGLEFERVYVVGVYPQKGSFPNPDVPEELPEGLVDRLGDERGARARCDDEERRLFYVACTRAASRLMLLGKLPKTKPRLHFLHELVGHELVSRVEASEALREGPRRTALERLGADFAARRERQDRLDAALADVRAQAADALARAGEGAMDEAGATLAQLARRAAVVGHVRTHGEIPSWATDTPEASVAAGLVGAGVEGVRIAAPMTPPLDLSYSKIAAYEKCPRCFAFKYLLGLDEPTGLGMVLGNAVHEALHGHYELWRSADAEGGATPGRRELLERGRGALLGAWPAGLELEPGTMRQVERQLGGLWDELHDDGSNVVELERKVVLPYVHDGVQHRLTAKLDRVDQEGGVARIVDYKTGAVTARLTDEKTLASDLQMGIYVMALRHLWEDEELDGVCEYWVLSGPSVGRVAFGSLKMDKIRKSIGKAIDGMLAGDFERVGCRGEGICSLAGGA